MRSLALGVAWLCVLAFVGGCLDDDSDAPLDVTGWWRLEVDEAGTYRPVSQVAMVQEVGLVRASEPGNLLLSGSSLTGTFQSEVDGEDEDWSLSAANALITGTVTVLSGAAAGQTRSVRLNRCEYPGGSSGMTVKFGFGPDWPITSTVSSANAYGARTYDTGVLTGIVVRGTCYRGADLVFRQLELSGFSAMGVGAYDVASGDIDVTAIGADLEPSEQAVAGTVDVTSFDDSGISGTFDLTLTTTGLFVGSFAVTFAYDRIEGP